MSASTSQSRSQLSISHTAKSTYLACPRRYWLKYSKRLEPKLEPKPLRMGSAFSRALEVWNVSGAVAWYDEYWTEHPAEKFAGQTLERDIVVLMARLYMEQYKDHKRELRVPDRDIGGCNFSGYIDGELASGVIVEDKFKGQWTATDIEALKQDDQSLGYVDSYSRILGCRPSEVVVEYRVTRKPGLRQRKDETDSEFLTRIEQDVRARPDHYFMVESIEFTDAQVREWLEDTEEVAAMIVTSDNAGSWPKNRASCKSFGGLCPYWRICSATSEDEVEGALVNFTEREIRE